MAVSSRVSVRRTMLRYQVRYLLAGSLIVIAAGTLRNFDHFPFPGNSFPKAPASATSIPRQPAVIDARLGTAEKFHTGSVHALSREATDALRAALMKPTISQVPQQTEASFVLDLAHLELPSPVVPAQPDQSNTPGKIAASEESLEPDPPISILEATAEPVPKAPKVAPDPVPRPPDLRTVEAKPYKVQRSVASASAPVGNTAVASLPADNRSFIEKLFGATPVSPPNSDLRNASLGNTTGSIAPDAGLSPYPNLKVDATTAIYDISAKVVVMPSGERLEAHSGLGDMMDDPRFVHVRMKGATPPGTYVLSERETLFHGVRALRMKPVGGSSAIFGRAGILTHPFMLGPNGDSNGCVSIKDHNRFLQAYLRGEVKRVVVMLGRGLDPLPRLAAAR